MDFKPNRVMKRLIYVMFIIITLTSCLLDEKPNDLKEYGFRGKVKSVNTINYGNLKKVNGKWMINEDKIISKSNLMFNEKGFIVKWVESYPFVDSIWDKSTSIVEIVNGQKSKFTKTNQFGQKTETGVYTWIDNFNYTLNVTYMNGTKVVSHSTLNKAYRDLKSDYSYAFSDSIYFSESYQNKLNQDEEIISSSFKNALTNNEYVINYTDKEKDEKGNLTKVVLVYDDSNELIRLVLREFDYYE
jgi:hypothetical protein